MHRILFPIDLGCELKAEVETKNFDLPRNKPHCVELKVYKFGICVVDFQVESDPDIENINKTKLANRMTIGTYKKQIEKYVLELTQPYRIDTINQRYDSEFFYPVTISERKENVSEDQATIPLGYLDVLKLAIAQYWNLVSYDVLLNKECDFAEQMTRQINPTFNFIQIIRNYLLLFKEGKEFHRDKLNIVNSLYSLMKENRYNSSPELIEFYKECRQSLGLDDLEKSVDKKIEQVSSTYAFLSENMTTLFFIFFELGFFIWLFWGCLDTVLLWRIGLHK